MLSCEEAYSAPLHGIRFQYTGSMAVVHLPDTTKTWINFVGIGVWFTGLGWVTVHFLIKPQDPLGFANSSSEPLWLKIHGAFAFLALWTGGMLWGIHVVKAWGTGRQRWSGSTLFGASLILIVTGYLLYYVVDDRIRNAISWIHWLLGIALPLAYLVHRLAKKIRPSRR
jgi:hypothetical protein